jgi:hypothetical protein
MDVWHEVPNTNAVAVLARNFVRNGPVQVGDSIGQLGRR